MTTTARWAASKDFWIGVFYLALGSVGAMLARDYTFGSAGRMGPGYFPTVISVLLIGFGLASLLRAWRTPGETVGALNLKGLALIAGSVFAFGYLLPRAGLGAAMVALVLLSALASSRFRLGWRPLVGLAALTGFCVGVFVYGLGIPMPLVGSWFHSPSLSG
jgi:hypothetical protein